MFTNFYCVVQSSAWSLNAAAFDILRRGADKKRIVVDASKGIAHRFRPLVGDVIRPSPSQHASGGADIEVKACRWTGDEATTIKFKPVAEVTLSLNYPGRGDGQGLGFGTDDELLVLKDAFSGTHPGSVHRPTIKKPTRKKQRFSAELYVEKMTFNIKEYDE